MVKQESGCVVKRVYEDWYILTSKVEGSELSKIHLVRFSNETFVDLGNHRWPQNTLFMSELNSQAKEDNKVQIFTLANIEEDLNLTEEELEAYVKLNKTNNPNRIIMHQFEFD